MIGRLSTKILASVLLAAGVSGALASPMRTIPVQLSADMPQAVSGRLLLFAVPAADAPKVEEKVVEVDISLFNPTLVTAAAMEQANWSPGEVRQMDTERTVFPAAYSSLPDGDYILQAVLDVNHDYAYGGRGPGDLISEPTSVHFGGGEMTTVVIDQTVPEAADPWALPEDAPADAREAMAALRGSVTEINLPSHLLSTFWGRPVLLRGWVLTPPDYAANPKQRYPTGYMTHGFGGTQRGLLGSARRLDQGMRNGDLPPMIWVLLDQSVPGGTHEFADSVNNGPWGSALTQELIPQLERDFRMDAKPSGRLLTGHSSGGWATLWMQVTYPKVFGGTWSTSPDSSTFADFSGIDLNAENANAYFAADGSERPLVRAGDKVIMTVQQYAHMERVLGDWGGQLTSFDWVFSPRGEDGRPMSMFDRDTGAVDPTVVAYWNEHYDIVRQLKTHWSTLKPDLDGKIHLWVGDADTFYLEGAARLMKSALDALGAKADIKLLPGKSHFDLFSEGEDRMALWRKMIWQMYGVARPGSELKSPVRTPVE